MERQGQLEDSTVTDGVRWAHYAAAFLLTAYFVSVALRHVGSYIAPIDGWGVDLFEVAVGVLCMLRYWHGSWRTMQSVVAYFPLVLGAACISWGFGDTALTIESLGGATPSTPSAADGFGLMFFPLCYVALVMLLRGESKRAEVTPWLDRAIAALGFASVAAAFALQPVLNAAGGWSLATATGIAYPVGDLLLVGVIAGGFTTASRARRNVLVVLGLAQVVNFAGDLYALVAARQHCRQPGELAGVAGLNLDVLGGGVDAACQRGEHQQGSSRRLRAARTRRGRESRHLGLRQHR